MIEQIMYFALGVLIATLAALLVLPAVWHRAVRLTTRRVEAAVPVSMFEVQADKDQQRAFFALNRRRLELQTEAQRETLVTQATTIEHQRQTLAALASAKATLEAEVRRLKGLSADEAVMVGELQDQVADRDTATRQLAADLAARGDELATARAALEQMKAQEARATGASASGGSASAEGDAALRQALAEVAAKLVVLTVQVEGAPSPIPALVAGSTDGLAGRIRALLDDKPQAAE